MEHRPPRSEADPALSLGRDHPLFYMVLVVCLAALTGATARQLRRPSPNPPVLVSGEPALAEAVARAEPHHPDHPAAAPRVHIK